MDPRERSRSLLIVMVGAGILLIFDSIGEAYWPFELSIGRPNEVGLGSAYFLLHWVLFGTGAIAFATWGLVRLESGWRRRAVHLWNSHGDFGWALVLTGLAMLIPALIRALVLKGAPVVDDESAYQLSAELLARGRLTGDSHALPLFFDRVFMVNDGRIYSQYFLGWPALMAPGVKAGIPGYMNAIYSGLAMPALYLTVRRLAGSSTARVAGALYVTSPMLMIAGATEMAHTTCFASLMWLVWMMLRSTDEDAPLWSNAGVAVTFSLAFFIRPTSAIGIGLPFLVAWALAIRTRSNRWRAVLWFVVPAGLCGGLFLAVNALQNGGVAATAYQAALDYARANKFRFTNWTPENLSLETSWWGFRHALANVGLASLRMNAALFGWCCSLVAIPFAWRRRGSGLFFAASGWFLLSHVLVKNIGVDTFGPVHYFELGVPLVLLSAIGIRAATEMLSRLATETRCRFDLGAIPGTAVALLIVGSLMVYWPARLRAVGTSADSLNMVLEAPSRAGLDNVVIFANRPLLSPCLGPRARGWVFWRPNNNPDLSNEVLWVNHITVEHDRQLMSHFPGRRGWLLGWTGDCQVTLLPLDELGPGDVPPGNIGGSGEID